MSIHIQRLSQVIIKLSIEGDYNKKMEKDLDKTIKKQIEDTKKPLFYLVDLKNNSNEVAEEIAKIIIDKLEKRGDVIQNIALLFNKKKKIKNKNMKKKIKIFDNEFQAQSWLSDQSRFSFLDRITIEDLMKK